MAHEIAFTLQGEEAPALKQVLHHLKDIRNITHAEGSNISASLPSQNLLLQLKSLTEILISAGLSREAEALSDVYTLSISPTDFGGLGYTADSQLEQKEEAEILFLVSAWLEALNSADRSKAPAKLLPDRPEGRRPMTMSEKVFAAHDIDRLGSVKPGDVVRVNVDWIMASELSWSGMENAYNALGKPGIFRNDRFWLAGDHVIDPRIKEIPKVKALVKSSERARDQFRMTEYQGMNYTIMHTEFSRERAQPGMLVIGSDSHTCSAGSVGALAIGLGVADVVMPLITGETWFRIPETVNIRFINTPSPGIGGKDTILYIMKELKRNTVAADRVVEFTGPGLAHLSCDARFAIANMTTEFGGVSGIFAPDQVTFDFVNRRKSPRHKKNSDYFRPDEDAEYAATHVIDLAQVESFVARYPSPDDVVPVSELADVKLDGCFIGACTTAEEDLILGAMVLEAGLRKGLVPSKQGKKKVVPGSLPILNRLKSLGFADIYEQAGFQIGVPGCSYCVGMGADKAGEGEVWISSQNRNFKNRMGPGSIGHLGSAATVAASSFDMKITDPRPFLDAIDQTRLKEILGQNSIHEPKKSPVYVEPGQGAALPAAAQDAEPVRKVSSTDEKPAVELPSEDRPQAVGSGTPDIRQGKIQRLGDFIDTDALAPSESLTICKTNEEFGQYCLKHTHPEFRARAKDGYNVVVAGQAFGCGSSRENAVNALLGVGIICVIARSFAFIYGRNQPNLGLLGITITDDSFYEAAADGASIDIDLDDTKVRIGEKEWSFQFSKMERELTQAGGLSNAFRKFGGKLFEIMCAPTKIQAPVVAADDGCGNSKGLEW